MAERIQFAPRGRSEHSDPADILIPALAKLRRCETGFDVVLLIEELPDSILPRLTWEAARKPFIPRVAVKALVKACGQAFLEGQLGRGRARELMTRFGPEAV